jgi:hypothetical protein
MTARTTVRLPEELLKQAKRKAVEEGRTLAALIEEGLRLVVSRQGKSRSSTRNNPPVSTAKGGLLPGIDLTSFSAFEEAEDLASLARLQRRK